MWRNYLTRERHQILNKKQESKQGDWEMNWGVCLWTLSTPWMYMMREKSHLILIDITLYEKLKVGVKIEQASS